MPSPYTTDKEKASYAIGMNIGNCLQHDGLDVDPNIVAQGLKDAMSGATSKISDADAQDAMNKLRTAGDGEEAGGAVAGRRCQQEGGRQFLAANKAKEGVVTLPDGLQYKI